jgi:hypothetical protein
MSVARDAYTEIPPRREPRYVFLSKKMAMVDEHSQPIKLAENVRALNGQVNHHLVNLGVAISPADDKGDLHVVDLLSKTDGVILLRQRITSPMIKDVTSVDDEVYLGKDTPHNFFPALKPSVSIAQNSDAHKPLLFFCGTGSSGL